MNRTILLQRGTGFPLLIIRQGKAARGKTAEERQTPGRYHQSAVFLHSFSV
jgi:hypothetical protein